MKTLVYVMIGAFLVAGILGCAALGIQGGMSPKVTVVTPKVKLSKKAKVTIEGTDFKPKQEVEILFTAIDGIQSDIGYVLKPKPVADETGMWTTEWSCGRFVAKKLIKEGLYTITVTDTDYNVLAEATVSFYAGK